MSGLKSDEVSCMYSAFSASDDCSWVHSPPVPGTLFTKLPSRMRPLNMEGVVGVTLRVANTRLAAKRRVVYPAFKNTAPGAFIHDGKVGE